VCVRSVVKIRLPSSSQAAGVAPWLFPVAVKKSIESLRFILNGPRSALPVAALLAGFGKIGEKCVHAALGAVRCFVGSPFSWQLLPVMDATCLVKATTQ
jgi:hypothetical protein